MFRLFVRDGLLAGVLLALLAGAAALLGFPALAPPPAAPWDPEVARLTADPILLARDAALGAFGLAAVVALLRLLASGLRLVGRDYPAMAHLAEVLAGALARRVGAVVGVSLTVLQGGGLARVIAAPRPVSGAPRAPLATLAGRPAAPPDLSTRSATRAAPRRPLTSAGTGARQPLRRVGLALRYTVQSGDTMEEVAERFGLPGWRPIWRATRGRPQPVGGPITDPALIFPGQALLIPLPCPAVRVSGDRVLHVVQRQEYLSEIAARFLGDWRAYRAIGDLNRGVHQPDGGALENDNLIQPGWVLRLPQEYVVTAPDGLAVTRRGIVADTRPVHLRRGLRPRRLGASSAPHHGATQQPGHGHVAGHARRGRHTQPHARPPEATPSPSVARRPADGQDATARHQGERRRASSPPPARRSGVHPPQRRAHTGSSRGAVVRPKRHVHPRGSAGAVPRRSPMTPAPTVRPVPIVQGGRVHAPTTGTGQRRPAPPPLTDAGRALPLPVLLVFVPLLALVALKRRRLAGMLRVIPTRAGTRLVPSMRRAIEAARDGVHGRLETAVATAGAGEGDVVASVATLLEGASAAAGLPNSLAGLIHTVTATADTINVAVGARGLSDEALAAVAAEVGNVLGTPVRVDRIVGTTNPPRAKLIVARTAVAAHGRAHPAPTRPHPAPLLIPLGRTAARADLYVNLARLGPILIAGGARGSNTLVATLLASALAQADPTRLRLLVSSNDDELRGMLPALEHLEAPPADARDVAAAGIVAQAHTLVLERFAAGDAGLTDPAYLVVLDTIEEMRADPRALDRLDVLCRNGRVCGVHVVATTSEPRALAEAGLLEAFETRLARPLRPEDSHLLYGDDSAARLDLDEALLRAGATDDVRLSPFTLPLPLVRAVVAHIAVALAPAQNRDTPATPPPADGTAPPEKSEPTSTANAARPVAQGDSPAPRPESDSARPTAAPMGAREVERDDAADGDAAAPRGGTDGTVTIPEHGREGDPGHAPTPAEATTRTSTAQAMHDHHRTSSDGEGTAMDGEAARLVEVRVLGGLTVLARGAPVVMQPREQRLLAALAIMGPTPVRPDRLIEALFADDDPLTGQDKLQHSITDVRLVLKKAGVPVKRAGVVRYTNAGYSLDTALVRADAHLFRDLLRRSETADARERAALLARAVELYQGDLCGDQELEWVEGYRYAWRKEYLEALYELALHYEQVENDPLGALRVARRLAAEEPLQDHYHQMALELIAATGDLDALDRYEEEMRATYTRRDTEIDGYTQALVERLRAQVGRDRRTTDDPTTKAS